MKGYFFKAFLCCFFSLLLLFAYEAAYPFFPILHNFESPHFWTEYSVKNKSNLLVADSTALLEDLKSLESDTISTDSILNDSSMAFQAKFNFKRAKLPEELEKYDGTEYLSGFVEKLLDLKQGKRKKVRIAYFGDSTSECDLIVSDLRNMLQRIFGGSGVGFVSVAPLGASGRRSIIHRHSPNWSVVSYFRQNKNPAFSFGLSGDYSTATSSSMDLSHKLGFQSANKLNNVFLYYGRGKTELFPDVMVGDSNSLQLSGKDLLNRIQLNTNNSKSIDLAFNFPEPFPIYGLSFESDYGIIVDNLAKRSDSGSNFGRISKEMLAGFNKYMEYDLIVLHFGANVLSNEQLNYNHYEQILVSTVRHFKESMGDIPVLIVGTTDRVAKIEGSEWTSPAVYPLSNAQRRAAAISQSPFLDLFTKMGGEGSMVKWVKSNPPLAAPDYVHLSGKGSKEIAGYVFDYLANAYEKFSGQSIKNNSSSKK